MVGPPLLDGEVAGGQAGVDGYAGKGDIQQGATLQKLENVKGRLNPAGALIVCELHFYGYVLQGVVIRVDVVEQG